MILLHLFAIFFKIGLFTIGGGLATLPLLQQEMLSRGWLTQAEFIDMIAISQSTPGPIGVNLATFVGFRLASYSGAVIATCALSAPSVIIIVLIARFLRDYAHLPFVEGALSGLRPAAVGLIAAATWFILGKSVFFSDLFPDAGWFDLKAFVLFIVLGVAYRIRKASPIIYIMLGGIAGILFF
ncbi:MAG: chromate transporter, partial [Candidatus Vecturithrix sp.]|jgi:chromate transporter|nr:chromate transporter [Candidatus Vecturithrix sp.]